jgi:hypothetical protein
MCGRSCCLLLLLCVCAVAAAQARWQACLPTGVEADTIVALEPAGSAQTTKQTTVKQRLQQLKARCRKGQLVDGKGRPIYFYRLTGCWGNPPADYLDILARQRRELSALQRRYTVIELSCNPTGALIQ